MKRAFFLSMIACLLVGHAFAQSLPPETSPLGQVLNLHGVGGADGRYIQWASSSGGDWTLGWLKQNGDGSSHQLMAKFRSNANSSRDLTSLYVVDTKTGMRTNLFPNTSRVGWTLSWVGPNFVVMNRNSSGLFYGYRGTPSTLPIKEISGAYEDPKFNLTVNLSKGPQPPAADGSSGILGAYTLQVSSSRPISQSDLQIIVDIDDATGKTVRQDFVRINPTSATALNASAEYVLGSWHYLLQGGEYTANFELRDRRAPVAGGKFVAGATKVFTLKSTTSR